MLKKISHLLGLNHLNHIQAIWYISYSLIIKNEVSRKNLINFLRDNSSYKLSFRTLHQATKFLLEQKFITVTYKNKDKWYKIVEGQFSLMEVYAQQWVLYCANQLPKVQELPQTSRRSER